MDAYDPVPELVRLGYTPREAAFLCLVGRVSGYFLGRQYSTFLQRKPGALICQLIEKGRSRQHFEALDYGQNRYIYHLKSKLIYRVLDCENSQQRRSKGDDEIKIRLMVLDYVLDHLSQECLSLDSEKIHYFTERKGIDLFHLSSRITFTDRFPIFVAENNGKSFPTFTYFDGGTTTVKPFARLLKTLAPIFETLDHFELNYIALSTRNFTAANAAFEKQLPEISAPKSHLLLPYGPDHLASYFLAQRLWDENSPRFKPEHLAVLRQGEQVYNQQEHKRLRSAWVQGADNLKQELRELCGIRQMSGRFDTTLLRGTFPLLRCRQRGTQSVTTVLDVAV